jgi:hypothetical protein
MTLDSPSWISVAGQANWSAAIKATDHHVIVESGEDRRAVLPSETDRFDALIFVHVLAHVADPIALFAELAAYSHPRAGWLAIVQDDTGSEAHICREAATTDARYLNHFGRAQRLSSLLEAVGIGFASHTIVTRAIARSHDDLLTVVAFYLDGVVDELVERLGVHAFSRAQRRLRPDHPPPGLHLLLATGARTARSVSSWSRPIRARASIEASRRGGRTKSPGSKPIDQTAYPSAFSHQGPCPGSAAAETGTGRTLGRTISCL